MAYFPGTQSFRQGFPRKRTKQGGNNRRAVTANGLPNLMARGLPVPGREAGNRMPLSARTNPPTSPTPVTEPIKPPTRQQALTGGFGSDIAQQWLKAFDPGQQRQNRRQWLREAGQEDTDTGAVTRRQAMEGGLGSDIASQWLKGFKPGQQRQNRRQGLRQDRRQDALMEGMPTEYGRDMFADASRKQIHDWMTGGLMGADVPYADRAIAALAASRRGDVLQEARNPTAPEAEALPPGVSPGAGGNYTGPLSDLTIQRGANGVPDIRGTLEQAGLWHAAPEQPSGNLFDAAGNYIGPPISSVQGSVSSVPAPAPAPAPTPFSFSPNTQALQGLPAGEERQAARQLQRQEARQGWRQTNAAPTAPAPTAPLAPAPTAPGPAGPQSGAGTPPMADEYQQALARMGLPLDPVYEMLSNQARSQRDIGLMNVNTAYDTQKAQAELQNVLAHRGIDENAAARGLYGSGIEARNERLQNTEYTQGLLGLLQQKLLGTQGAYSGYANAMQQAILDLAQRQMQDPYSAVPNYYDWMTGESTIANDQQGGGADRLARLRELLRTGDLTDRQRERVRTRIQGIRG